MNLEIEKAVVLLNPHGPDKIFLHTTLPSSFPRVSEQSLVLSFEATADTGADYVREHFLMEPEVIQR